MGTADLPRARAFYAQILGLPVVAEDAYACTFEAHGTPLRLTRVDETTVAPYTHRGWSVRDIDGTVQSLAAAGVTFERFAGMDQDEMGTWRAPNGVRVAWFKDPDGHTLSVTQDESVAMQS